LVIGKLKEEEEGSLGRRRGRRKGKEEEKEENGKLGSCDVHMTLREEEVERVWAMGEAKADTKMGQRT